MEIMEKKIALGFDIHHGQCVNNVRHHNLQRKLEKVGLMDCSDKAETCMENVQGIYHRTLQ